MTERQFRALITTLLVIPFTFGMDAIIRPIRPNTGDMREIIYPIFAIPILFLAYSIWVSPQYIQGMFGPFRSESSPTENQLTRLYLSIPPQRRKIALISTAVFGALVFFTLINISLFALRVATEKAAAEKVEVIPVSRSDGVLPTSQLFDERTPSPEATEPETATATQEAPTAMALQQNAVNSVTPAVTSLATASPATTAGVTPSPSKATRLTTTPSVAATQQACSVGTQCVVNGVGVTVVNVSKMNNIDTATPAAGNTYLVVNVIIQNVDSGDSMLYAPTYFSVQDSTGAQYSPSSVSLEPILSSGPLPQGGTADGNVSFEVKAASSGFVITYAPPALNGSSSIRINLGQ